MFILRLSAVLAQPYAFWYHFSRQEGAVLVPTTEGYPAQMGGTFARSHGDRSEAMRNHVCGGRSRRIGGFWCYARRRHGGHDRRRRQLRGPRSRNHLQIVENERHGHSKRPQLVAFSLALWRLSSVNYSQWLSARRWPEILLLHLLQ